LNLLETLRRAEEIGVEELSLYWVTGRTITVPVDRLISAIAKYNYHIKPLSESDWQGMRELARSDDDVDNVIGFYVRCFNIHPDEERYATNSINEAILKKLLWRDDNEEDH